MFYRLFTSVPDDVFDGPTIRKLIPFFDTWIPDSKATEKVSQKIEDEFLDAIMATIVMQKAHNFIISKSKT